MVFFVQDGNPKSTWLCGPYTDTTLSPVRVPTPHQYTVFLGLQPCQVSWWDESVIPASQLLKKGETLSISILSLPRTAAYLPSLSQKAVVRGQFKDRDLSHLASLPFPRWTLSEFPGQSIVGMIPQDFLKLFLEAMPASFRPARFPWAGTSSKTLLKALRNGMIFYHPSTCTFCSHLPFFDVDYTFITLLWSSRTS